MRCAILWAFLLLPLFARAQSWQQVFDDVMTTDTDDEAGELLTDSYELLEQLASHPLDLNRCTREELEQLPFLSAQQVMDLQEYLYRYGPMRSLGELRMIRSLDRQQLSLLPFFVYVGQDYEQATPPPPRLDTLFRHARHTLSFTGRIPFYERRGDKNGYLGYPYRHTLRYELSSLKHLRLGIVAAQDAGEPFLAKGNNWGYDAYSYYVDLRQMGRLQRLVAGRYKLAAGMGLVLGQSFQLGKLASLQSLGRSISTVRPHASRSEADYFQGAAATVDLLRSGTTRAPNSPHLLLTAFASYRPIDATLTADGQAQTLITSGYHRTPTEMDKKGNTHIGAGGAHIIYNRGALRLGATATYSQLDRRLEPQRQTLFRRHYAHGRHFLNASADYGYTHHRVALSGETAIDGHGALATANALSFQPSGRLSLLAVQRFYSYRYTTLYGHSFGEGSRTQNESGLYVGATWNPLAHLRLQGYADYAYFPWARYQVSQSSHAWDFLLQATWQRGRWTLLARHRTRLRQKDNAQHTALTANDSHQQRLSATYSQGPWSWRTQLDLSQTRSPQTDNGWMLSQHLLWTHRAVQLSMMGALFDTDSYQSRLYVYERQLRHEFYFPSYYGHGLRLNVQAQADLSSNLSLAVRLGYTNYFDRSAIGSGLQQILHSHQSDLDLQLRWRF